MIRIILLIFLFTLFSKLSVAGEKGWFSDIVDDISSSDLEGAIKRREVRNWYSENKGKLVISNSETLSCNKSKEWIIKPSYVSEGKFIETYNCSISIEMINHSNHKLSGLIVKIRVYNEDNEQLVTEGFVSLPVSIYPTVKLRKKINFRGGNIGQAAVQLGSNFSWNYDLIAYLPPEYFYKDESIRETSFFTPDWVGDYSWLE